MSRRYERSDRALWRRTTDAIVLLAVGDNQTITIADPVARVWDLLAQPITLETVIDRLSLGESAPPKQEVAEILDELERRGLVSVGEGQ